MTREDDDVPAPCVICEEKPHDTICEKCSRLICYPCCADLELVVCIECDGATS